MARTDVERFVNDLGKKGSLLENLRPSATGLVGSMGGIGKSLDYNITLNEVKSCIRLDGRQKSISKKLDVRKRASSVAALTDPVQTTALACSATNVSINMPPPRASLPVLLATVIADSITAGSRRRQMNMNDARHLRWMAGVGAAFVAFGAAAADLASPPVAPVAENVAAGLSPWQIRVRGLGVITEDSGSINGVPGSDLSYSDSLIPELDISYFFTDNIAAELVLGTTYTNIKEDGAVGVPVGKAWLLPPTLTLQYHFTDFGAFKPYVGAGINYSLFYNQSEKPGFHNLDVDNHVGAALQVGFDYMVDEHWGVNFDVKKIFLETEWKADHDVLGPLSGKAKIDPWLIGAGVTYRF